MAHLLVKHKHSRRLEDGYKARMRPRLILLTSMVLGCATAESARDNRRDQLRSAQALLPKVPLDSADGVELRFQTAELKLLHALDLLETGDREGADQARYEAGLLLDELIQKAPSSPRLPEIVSSRASVAVLRARHEEAVPLLRRGLALPGQSPQNETFLRANLVRSLRLSGDCPGALAEPIPEGPVAASIRFERAACLRSTPEVACDELLATVRTGVTPEARLLRALRVELKSFAPAARTGCLERFPEPVRSAVDAPP